MKPPPHGVVAAAMEHLLHLRGRTHLRVKARGDHFTIFSEENGQAEPRLRLTVIATGRYGLSFRHHTGKWESAPISGSLTEVFDAVEAMGGWHLDPWPASATNF